MAIGVNAAMLYVALHLLAWGWPAFLTDDFEEVLPLVVFSFVVTMAVNVAYLWFDPAPFKSLGNLVTSIVGVAVALRTLRVFPFDFSSYDHDFAGLVRVLLILAIFGGFVGVLVETAARSMSGRRH